MPPSDSPPSSPRLAAHIVLENRKAYQLYNIARLEEVLRTLPPRQGEVFSLIPFFLHANFPKLPGYVPGDVQPGGIWQFHRSGFWKHARDRLKLDRIHLNAHIPPHPMIAGLYLMGSLGTLAQTETSDFDVWVIYDEEITGKKALSALREKLQKLHSWGATAHHMEINFYLMNQKDLFQNRFPALNTESSGSSQKFLLKEEFYRSFIHLAGKIPFWAVLPPSLSRDAYSNWIRQMETARNINLDTDEFMDMGHVAAIPRSESLSALVWQLFKARTDPVKALIKATLITVYHYQPKRPLLCDQVKDHYSFIHASPRQADPYALLFDTVSAFFSDMQDPAGRDLIRSCIFLRLTRRPPEPGSPRERLIRDYTEEWNWSPSWIRHLNRYAAWPEADKRALDLKIIEKLTFLFQILLKGDDISDTEFEMDAADIRLLKNKIQVGFRQHPDKIPPCSAFFRHKVRVRQMRIEALPAKQATPPSWQVCDEAPVFETHQEDAVLFRADTLLKIAGWLVFNGLVTEEGFSGRILPCGGTASGETIRTLINRSVRHFLAARRTQPDLDPKPEYERVVVLMPQAVPTSCGPVKAQLLFRNTWGEYLHHAIDLTQIANRFLQCYEVAMGIARRFSATDDRPFHCLVLSEDRSDAGYATQTIEKILRETRLQPRDKPTDQSPPSDDFTPGDLLIDDF